jgi:hypothetical protein
LVHDCRWKLVYTDGRAPRSLSLQTDGTAVKGSQMADGNSTEIFDGTVNGNEISWKVSITDPMPMTLEFTGTVDRDEIAGTVKLGEFGNSSFLGIRNFSNDPVPSRCSIFEPLWKCDGP